MNEYKKIQLKLTAVYFAIIFIIVAVFSIIVYETQFTQFSKFESFFQTVKNTADPTQILVRPNDDVNGRPLRLSEIQDRINDLRINTIINIVLLDGILLFTGGVASYILARKNTEPIINSLEKQKRFVGDASHELKTPLTVIRTEAEVLLRSENTTNEEYKEFVKNTVSDIDTLTKLTNNLLTIAKLDYKPVDATASFENINMNELIHKCVENFTPIADKNNIKIEFESKEVPLIKGNKEHLNNLISILIDNAIKYNKENGTIKINMNAYDHKLDITVEDTGVGINKENIAKIFDRFYRVSEDRNKKGFGLGLSIAKQITEEHHAKIAVDSEVEKFTRIKITFNTNL